MPQPAEFLIIAVPRFTALKYLSVHGLQPYRTWTFHDDDERRRA
jgi:hypothetical protein